MDKVSFHGDIAGNISDKNKVTKGESTGSIGYKYAAFNEEIPDINRTLDNDTVSFRGYNRYGEYEKGVSTASMVFGTAAVAALAIVGLGYAQKYGAISKINNKNVKNVLNKIAEPCYKICSKIKNLSLDCYSKVKSVFTKK